MHSLYTPFFWLLTTGYCLAQTLSGSVRDARMQQPLPGVTLRLLPSQKGVTSDGRGHFVFHNLPKGTYTVRVSSVGYQTTNVTLSIAARTDQRITVLLQPTSIQLNQQTVSTVTRTETPDFVRPEVTTVLTTRDLAQRAPRTVPEALFGATGVWLQKTNHGGGSPFVRGLTGQQTLLLIDGIRLNNATFRSGPNQYLNTIDPQSISQIEVIRSSGSVAYGSDAIGGVVNVLTKTPQFSEQSRFIGSVFAKAMTQNMEYTGRAEAGFSSANVAVLGGIAYRKFGDLVAGQGLGRLTPTGYNQFSGDVKARVRLSNRLIATAAYQHLQQDSVPLYHRVRLENYRYYQFDPQQRKLGYARLEGFYNRPYLQSIQLTASWQRQTEGRQSQRNSSPTAVYERDQTTSLGLTLLANAEPTTFWRMQNGLELYSDYIRSSRTDTNFTTGVATARRGLYPDRASMNSLALFSLHTLTLKRLTFTAGGRYNVYRIVIPGQTNGQPGIGLNDRASISPSALVGNVGASFALLPTLRLVGSVGSAFRELPNASLRPERSLNTEVGLKLRTNRLSATVLAYHNRLTDFINRVRSGTDSLQGYPVYRKENSAESFIRGLEADVEYEFLPSWLAYAGLTYTYGQNITANEPFRRIPPLSGRVGLTCQPAAKRWWARAEWLGAGAQTRLAAADVADNRIAKGGTPGWQVINLNGGYRWRNLTLSAELQNLTNEAYRTHGSGVDGVGRSAWLSVLASF